jgi:hypothetical protein
LAFDYGWSVPDPRQRWTEMVQQWGRGHVQEVLGRPAFVQPTGELDPFGTPYRGQLLLILGTTLVTVHGNGEIPAEELVAIISTIEVSDPLS